MDVLDVFSRTFLPLAEEAGIASVTVTRHAPLIRSQVDGDDPALLVAQCSRPDRPVGGTHVLVITKRQLVVTSETRLLRRPRLHLASPVEDLESVTWSADPVAAALDLALSTAEGRQRFWIRGLHPRHLWRLDAALLKVFRASADAARRGVLVVPPRSPGRALPRPAAADR
jgi:hypothetical protein